MSHRPSDESGPVWPEARAEQCHFRVGIGEAIPGTVLGQCKALLQSTPTSLWSLRSANSAAPRCRNGFRVEPSSKLTRLEGGCGVGAFDVMVADTTTPCRTYRPTLKAQRRLARTRHRAFHLRDGCSPFPAVVAVVPQTEHRAYPASPVRRTARPPVVAAEWP